MPKKKEEKQKESIQDILKDIPSSPIEIVPTPNPLLNYILGGGIELGSVIQISGEAGIGKSTMALDLAHCLCANDKNVLYIDTEGSISKEILSSVGLAEVMDEKLFIVRNNTFQNVESIIDRFINTDQIHCIIIDSIAGLIHSGFTDITNKKKISITTDNTNYDSKKLNLFMKKYNAIAKTKNICIIFTNQNRNSVNMKTGSTVKNYGCKAVTYFADVILKIKNQKADNDFKKLTNSIEKGVALELEIIKSNKHAPKAFPIFLLYGKGISSIINNIYVLIQLGTIQKDGNGYYSIIKSKSKSKSKYKAHGIKELYEFYLHFLIEDEAVEKAVVNYYNSLWKSATPLIWYTHQAYL